MKQKQLILSCGDEMFVEKEYTNNNRNPFGMVYIAPYGAAICLGIFITTNILSLRDTGKQIFKLTNYTTISFQLTQSRRDVIFVV